MNATDTQASVAALARAGKQAQAIEAATAALARAAHWARPSASRCSTSAPKR